MSRDYVAEALGEVIQLKVDSGGREAESPKTEDWPVMDPAAFCGLAGDIVNAIDPHSEADPIAILIQTLTFFGNMIGSGPYYQVEADRHHANLFTVLVGVSAKGRKGTSAGRARSLFTSADEEWTRDRVKSGLSSGEGLINEVRDEVYKWDAKNKTYETVDPGIHDKRLMGTSKNRPCSSDATKLPANDSVSFPFRFINVHLGGCQRSVAKAIFRGSLMITEAEFASALAVMERPGNTLSPVLRNAWDGLALSTITKNSPLRATGAHISIAGHITEDELRARLTRTDAASGFGNRFLFPLVKRSKFLPFGGSLDEKEAEALRKRVKTGVEFARTIGQPITMTNSAREHWAAVYKDLSAGQSGLLGAITARAEAQTVRLALNYALFNGKTQIDVDHLKAALAVWEYCEASAAHIFGQALGDPVADEILHALQQAGSIGMSRTAIRDLFGRNRSGDRIGAALGLLVTNGRARPETRDTGGRPAEVWLAMRA